MVSESSKKREIVVAGHLVFDQIVFPGEKITTALGGISYNLAALCAVMKEGRLYTVCEIGLDREAEFDRAFGHCPVLDKSLIRAIDKPNVVNRLVYDRTGERKEWNSRIPEPLSLELIPDHADCVLINFISGDDFRLDELIRFRRRYQGLIYMDYHSLSLGRSPDGSRYYRKHPRWKEYIANADILQMNLAELASIAKHDLDLESASPACRSLHDSGPDTIIITMGVKGVLLSINSGSEVYLIPAVRIEQEVDSTGCGDTLAAITLIEYIITDDILNSVIKGCRWAAAKATFSGLDGFVDIENIMAGIGPSADPVRL